MKVFISWSGERSKQMATALKEWLPLILQYAKPWVSENDISAGDRWAQTIAGELENSNFGILCITPENLSSEWILFEAGALSKSMQDAKVIPLLFGLELSGLTGPLSQFQALKVDQDGMLNVAKAINNVAESKADESTINQLVPALWPQLEAKLADIPANGKSPKHMRPQTEILEDLVSQVRGLGSRISESNIELMDPEQHGFRSKSNRLDPRMLDELLDLSMWTEGSDMSLLVLAGIVRDRMPWLAEVLVESHREIKNVAPQDVTEIGYKLNRFLQQITRGTMSERLMVRSKSDFHMMMEIPHIIDRAISGLIEAKRNANEIEFDDSDI